MFFRIRAREKKKKGVGDRQTDQLKGGVMTQQIKGMKRKAGGEEAPNHMTPRVRKGSVRRGNRHVEVPEQNKIGRTESDKKDECKVANQGQDSVQKGGGKGTKEE